MSTHNIQFYWELEKIIPELLPNTLWGWLGGVKVSCILSQWGVQLILAYSWARPAILVARKGRGEIFLFLLFLHFHSCSSFFPVPLFHLHFLFYFLPFSGRWRKMTHKGWHVNKPQHNQSNTKYSFLTSPVSTIIFKKSFPTLSEWCLGKTNWKKRPTNIEDVSPYDWNFCWPWY